jgi:hypothetical protein
MNPEAAAIWMIPAHALKWLALLGGVVALCGLLCLLYNLRTAGEEIDAEIEEDEP